MFKNLAADEKRVVLECMSAILFGRFIDDFEFQTRLGVEKAELLGVVAAYPNLNDLDGKVELCINNCFNEVSYGVHIPPETWPLWFSVSRQRLSEIYEKWARLKGKQSTGLE